MVPFGKGVRGTAARLHDAILTELEAALGDKAPPRDQAVGQKTPPFAEAKRRGRNREEAVSD
jgi:hypothetical protein